MTTLVLVGSVLPLTTAAPAGAVVDPLINEFVVNHTGSDTSAFIEILGDASTDYSGFTLLEIEGDESSNEGTIDYVGTLGSTDGSGYWLSSEDVENGTVTLLLVEGFTGAAFDDLDTNDDGTPDVTPWTRIVDGVAIDDGDTGDLTYATPSLAASFDGGAFPPGGASRIPNGTDTDDASDWVRNAFNGAGLACCGGAVADPGEAINTPGAANAVQPTPAVINEFVFNHTGSDTSEFVEIFGDASTDYSSLTIVEIEGDGAAAGLIDDGTFAVGTTDGSGFWTTGFKDNVWENGTLTLLLVEGYSGTLGDDLDTDNDGVLDVTPWTSIVDGVAVDDGGADDRTYATPSLAAFFDGNAFSPGGASRIPNGTDTDDASDWTRNDFGGDGLPCCGGAVADVGEAVNTPGALNAVQLPPPFPPAFIYEVQGDGDASPMAGDGVTVEGVVVGDFQTGLGGFFLQEEDDDADGDPMTSDGIFVDGDSVDVAVGDIVEVKGTVSEFFGRTQIGAAEISVTGSGPLPAASTVTLPVASMDDFEKVEGMYVTFPQDLVISEFFNFDRFGEIVLTSVRQNQPTAVFDPGSADAAATAAANALDRVTLDDGRSGSNPDPAIHPNGAEFTLDNRFRGGDTVADVTGALDYTFGRYKVQPTQGAAYTSVNPRPALDDVGGTLTVAAFNVLNYFTTLDTGPDICGPNSDEGCRGADDANEFTRQRDKIIAALAAMDADVVGLNEIENHPSDAPLADLVTGLNAEMGAGTYDYIATGPVGDDVIRVAFIYKPASVTPYGLFAVLDTPDFIDPNSTGTDRNRAALAQSFSDNASGEVFTVTVNHLKSKGSPCGAGDDDPEAASCNLTRTLAAELLVDWLAGDPTGSGDVDQLIIGDLNSYDQEDPIDAIKAGPDDAPGTSDDYVDLVAQSMGPFAYSYVFDGQWGYLDYAMANGTMQAQVTGTTVWHINSDEPDIIDYDTSFKKAAQDAIYAPDAYRSSDHDPVIVGLRLDSPEVGLVDTEEGRWHLRPGQARAGVGLPAFYYGDPGDYPFMGDWDCDGVDTPGLYRQSDGFVYLRNANTQGVADITFLFGNPDDVPIAGDFNGDGCDTVSVYRPAEGRVFVINELGKDGGGLGAAELSYLFGDPGDIPFVGDFDGDGIDTIGLIRPTTGHVFLRNSHTQGVADMTFTFGNPGDLAFAGDWNHDGMDSVGVFRPSDSTFYLKFTNTAGPADMTMMWGDGDWMPISGSFGLIAG